MRESQSEDAENVYWTWLVTLQDAVVETPSFGHGLDGAGPYEAVRGYHRGLWVSMLNACIHNKPFGLGVVLLR